MSMEATPVAQSFDIVGIVSDFAAVEMISEVVLVMKDLSHFQQYC